MSTNRRQFLDSLAIGATAVATMPAALVAMPAEFRPSPAGDAQGAWDTRWADRLTGKVRTVFDVPEVESGYGVWRATIWQNQYEQVLGVPKRDLSTALVLRHNAIILAMQQGFWDKYGIGKAKHVTHPVTGEATDRNPALLGARDGLPEPMAANALDRFIAANEDSVGRFADQGLGEVDQLVRDMREAVSSFDRLSRRLEEEPSRLLYQPSTQGVEIPP